MRYLFSMSALTLAASLAVTTACQTTASQQQQPLLQQQSNNQKNAVNSTTVQIAQSTPEEARRISLEEAKAAFDKGNVVIVDTRDANAFKAEHIKGAINIPVGEFEKRYQELPPNKQIIVYCS